MYIENLPVFWLIVAILCAIAEIMLPTFGAIFGTVAGLIVAVLALSPVIIWQLQVVIFAILLVISMMYLRPLILARMEKSKGVASRTDALVGKLGTITVALDPVSKIGRANIEGSDWAVKSDAPLPENSKVMVVGNEGIVLTVKKSD